MAALIAPRPSSHPFQERQLSLKEPIKVGRAVAKAKATQNNGIFDCRVLSRNHAMLWYENGKFYLQDTKSSNGTFVNGVRLSRGSEESEPCEIKSGDILQFGVEVVENTKNVTHGCIIGLVTLFHEDGTEATGAIEEPQSVLSLASAEKPIQPKELWQLSQFLQDALHREQMLENKLATLQRMISNSHSASDDTFQGFIQEDKVLSRLETLENQLDLVSKDISDEESHSHLITYQNERLEYESAAKETLQKILSEKIEVLQKCSDLERLLSNTEDECTFLRNTWEKSKEELGTLMEKHKQITDELKQLKEDMSAAEVKHESTQQQTISEKDELKSLLEEAERRGSSLAVEVESLQAECDFTKQQLEAMKERLEAKQKEHDEEEKEKDEETDEDSEKHDLPFASDHATLEKDVKNKSALIKTLKEQIAEMQAKLENEQTENVSESIEQEVLRGAESDSFDEQIENCSSQINNLEELMTSLSQHFTQWSELAGLDLNLSLDSCIETRSIESKADCIASQQKAIDVCSKFLENFKDCFQELIARPSVDRELSQNSTDEAIKAQLCDAHLELEEVRRQIIVLADQLVEEQEINRRSTELAVTLQNQLYEAQKHMDIEKLDKSLSYQSLESARKLADEMKQQASDHAKAAGHERVENNSLQDENESLLMKVSRLESECKLLKQENQLLLKTQPSPRKTVSTTTSPSLEQQKNESSTSFEEEDFINSTNTESMTPEELHEQLKIANQSLEELSNDKEEVIEHFTERQRQMMNFIFTTMLLIFLFFVLVLLGLIDVSPGTLPLLDEHTLKELLEHLF